MDSPRVKPETLIAKGNTGALEVMRRGLKSPHLQVTAATLVQYRIAKIMWLIAHRILGSADSLRLEIAKR